MITINGQEYKVKFGLRAMFIFETITKKSFSIENTMDSYVLFYSMILAANKDCKLTFDDFIDAIDENPSIISELNKEFVNRNPIDKITEGDESKNVESL